jgi:hypothetical protein
MVRFFLIKSELTSDIPKTELSFGVKC